MVYPQVNFYTFKRYIKERGMTAMQSMERLKGELTVHEFETLAEYVLREGMYINRADYTKLVIGTERLRAMGEAEERKVDYNKILRSKR